MIYIKYIISWMKRILQEDDGKEVFKKKSDGGIIYFVWYCATKDSELIDSQYFMF